MARYINLESHTQKVNGHWWIYIYKYKCFCENFIFPKSINNGIMIIKGYPCKPSDNSLLSSLLLVVTNILKEIQLSSDSVDTARGWLLERLEELLQMIRVSMNFILY